MCGGNQSALDNRLLITHLACLYFGMKKSFIFHLYMRFSVAMKIIIDCISRVLEGKKAKYQFDQYFAFKYIYCAAKL